MNFRKKFIIASLFFILFLGFNITPAISQANMAGKAVKEASKKILKENIDDVAKLAGKEAIKKTYKKDIKKGLKKVFKKQGVKSLLQLSRKNGKIILGNPTALTTSRTSLLKNYNNYYTQSLKNPHLVSPKRNLSKICLRYGTKELFIPTGREALKVAWDPIKKCPRRVYNSLKDNGDKMAKEYNQMLLREQRKAISPYHQFLTTDQALNYDASSLILGKEASGKILRENLYRTMDKTAHKISWAFGGNAAHHIVEGKDASAIASRKLLKKFKIDINSPENGILLPTDMNSIYKGAVHKTSHSKAYSQYVHSKLSKAKNRKECIQILTDIKHELFNGKLTLEGPLQSINKNLKI